MLIMATFPALAGMNRVSAAFSVVMVPRTRGDEPGFGDVVCRGSSPHARGFLR